MIEGFRHLGSRGTSGCSTPAGSSIATLTLGKSSLHVIGAGHVVLPFGTSEPAVKLEDSICSFCSSAGYPAKHDELLGLHPGLSFRAFVPTSFGYLWIAHTSGKTFCTSIFS